MKLIVGLGNPGKKYEKTRHNLGFLTLDKIADHFGFTIEKKAFQGRYASFKIYDQDVILFKPNTYMNLSGIAVNEISRYYKISIDDLLVVYDDMAFEVGDVKLRLGGGSGAHNGVQNIIDQLANEQFKRIRIGIGKPAFNGSDYVLSKPSKEEEIKIKEAIEKAKDAILYYLKNDFALAMNHFNIK